MDKDTRITILCEDPQHARFVRYFLEKYYGIESRRITYKHHDKGKGSAEQWVRSNISKEVRALRKRRSENISLIVITDADTSSTITRRRQLMKELAESGEQPLSGSDRISIFIPKRNIETWIHFLNGEDVDEIQDYKHVVDKSSCKLVVKSFARSCKSGTPLRENSPASLRESCNTLQNIV